MTNPFFLLASLGLPFGGRFLIVIVPSGFLVMSGGGVADFADAVSVAAGFGGRGLSAPMTAAGGTLIATTAIIADRRFDDRFIVVRA